MRDYGHVGTGGMAIEYTLAVLILLCLGHATVSLEDCEASYCSELRPDECYYNARYCCQTCAQYATNVTDCEYGDRASVCRKEFCAYEWNWEVCCWTCADEIAEQKRNDTHVFTLTADVTTTSQLVSLSVSGPAAGTSFPTPIASTTPGLDYSTVDYRTTSYETTQGQPTSTYSAPLTSTQTRHLPSTTESAQVTSTQTQYQSPSSTGSATRTTQTEGQSPSSTESVPLTTQTSRQSPSSTESVPLTTQTERQSPSSTESVPLTTQTERQSPSSTESVPLTTQTERPSPSSTESIPLTTQTVYPSPSSTESTPLTTQTEHPSPSSTEPGPPTSPPTIPVSVQTSPQETTVLPSTSATTAPCTDGQVNGVDCAAFITADNSWYCYTYRNECCATCKKLEQEQQGCEYGDRASYCGTTERHRCYHRNPMCCETCARMRSNITGCEFGDKLERFCPSLEAYECYDMSPYCCQTCAKYRLPNAKPGCEYGNRRDEKICSTKTTEINCNHPYMRSMCCHTCGQ